MFYCPFCAAYRLLQRRGQQRDTMLTMCICQIGTSFSDRTDSGRSRLCWVWLAMNVEGLRNLESSLRNSPSQAPQGDGTMTGGDVYDLVRRHDCWLTLERWNGGTVEQWTGLVVIDSEIGRQPHLKSGQTTKASPPACLQSAADCVGVLLWEPPGS